MDLFGHRLTNAFLLAGVAASFFAPVAFAQAINPGGVASTSNGATIDMMLAIWIGGALIGGVVTALTFIFRLFLRSRDSTETALALRIAALESSLAEERKEGAGINTLMLDLLQGVVRDNGQVMQEHTKAIAEQSKVMTGLVVSIDENRKHSTEEHTRLLSAVSSIVAAYGRPMAGA